MDKVTEMVIKSSMRAMFDGGYISISKIKECLKLAAITPVGPTIDQLNALHCVHFQNMDRELAEMIPAMVASLFQGVSLSLDDLFQSPQTRVNANLTPAQKTSFMRRLGIATSGGN